MAPGQMQFTRMFRPAYSMAVTRVKLITPAFAADAGTPAGVEAMVGGAVEAFGGLDILHNNAFGQPPLPPGQSRLAFTGELDEQVWAHVINIGLTSVFRATKRAIPELL